MVKHDAAMFLQYDQSLLLSNVSASLATAADRFIIPKRGVRCCDCSLVTPTVGKAVTVSITSSTLCFICDYVID